MTYPLPLFPPPRVGRISFGRVGRISFGRVGRISFGRVGRRRDEARSRCEQPIDVGPYTSATRIPSIENRWRDGTSDHSGLKVSYQQKPVEAAGAVARKEKKTYTFAREVGHVTKKALAALANVLLLTTLAISITSASGDQLAAGSSPPAP